MLLYLNDEAKARFVETVRALDCVWVGNEAPGVLQAVDAQLVPRAMVASRFILSVDGTPRALTGQHGESLRRTLSREARTFARPRLEASLPSHQEPS